MLMLSGKRRPAPDGYAGAATPVHAVKHFRNATGDRRALVADDDQAIRHTDAAMAEQSVSYRTRVHVVLADNITT